jgi:hypothetical protein
MIRFLVRATLSFKDYGINHTFLSPRLSKRKLDLFDVSGIW